MTRVLRAIAPAKINWTLEVLHIRPDGYHEIRSVLQTIDLRDTITVTDAAAEITLELTGEPGMLADEPPRRNLAWRAAEALRAAAGVRRGVAIRLEKHVPVAAGLGGGSSDASAVLRACNMLWRTGLDDASLVKLASGLGSDPPFFITGGTAAVSGRGDRVDALPDAIAPPILLATPRQDHRGEKTAGMFAALTPGDFAEGYVTIGLREAVTARHPLDDALFNNTFERVTARMQPATELALDSLRAQGYAPHLAGSGPSFFLLLPDPSQERLLTERVRDLGFEPRLFHTLSRNDALRVEEI